MDGGPRLGVAIAVQVSEAVYAYVEALAVYHASITRTSPLDLVEHVLSILEKRILGFREVDRDDCDLVERPIACHRYRLKTAVGAVAIPVNIGRGNLGEDDVGP